MDQKMREIVLRALMARIVQCATQIEVLRDSPAMDDVSKAEQAAYWMGERQAAMTAMQNMHAPEFGA